MPQIPPFQPGRLTLEQMQMLRELANKVNNIVSGNIAIDNQTHAIGMTVPSPPRSRLVIRLDSKGTGANAGKYGWTLMAATDSSPYWAVLEQSGTVSDDPAIEVNSNGDIDVTSPVYVPAWREPGTNEMRFQMGACS